MHTHIYICIYYGYFRGCRKKRDQRPAAGAAADRVEGPSIRCMVCNSRGHVLCRRVMAAPPNGYDR